VDQGEKRDSYVVENKGRCASRWTGVVFGNCGLARGVPYRNFLTTWESDLLELSNFGSLGLAEQHRTPICRRR
jgi:hypothetical protein